jgi:Arm DNA-binding domain
MARTRHRLRALQVERTKTPGMYADGGGLYLQITSANAKSWIFRYAINGRERYMGLGPAHKGDVSLEAAREAASKCRELLRAGLDPIEHRKAELLQARVSSAKTMTFDECAQAYIAAHESGWSNPKHRAQWRSTLKGLAGPVFGKLPVQAIDTGLVMKVLEPLWTTKTETASRLRGRIESVLAWATVRGYRQGENPARWRGHLDHLLPERSRVRAIEQHPAHTDLHGRLARTRQHQRTGA